MRHLRLIFEFTLITIALYVIRPIEAVLSATWKGIQGFWFQAYNQFKYKMWRTTNLTPKICTK